MTPDEKANIDAAIKLAIKEGLIVEFVGPDGESYLALTERGRELAKTKVN